METSNEGIHMRQLMDEFNIISVKHWTKSSQFKPKKGNTWKEYWEIVMAPKKFPTQKEKCKCCDKDTLPEDFVGAHIVDINTNDKYIYPLCRKCNSKYGEGKEESPTFFVEKN